MQVSKLITELQKLPQDLDAVVFNNEWGEYDTILSVLPRYALIARSKNDWEKRGTAHVAPVDRMQDRYWDKIGNCDVIEIITDPSIK